MCNLNVNSRSEHGLDPAAQCFEPTAKATTNPPPLVSQASLLSCDIGVLSPTATAGTAA